MFHRLKLEVCHEIIVQVIEIIFIKDLQESSSILLCLNSKLFLEIFFEKVLWTF